MRRRSVAFAVLLLGAATAPDEAPAQVSALTAECAAIIADDARRFCNLVGNAILAVQPPVGVAATGGNPVPGTASTLGMRLGATPRLSLAGRVGFARAERPGVLDRTQSGGTAFVLPTLTADLTVGVFGGLSPAPTVGGLLSLDALAHAALLMPPAGAGFRGGAAFSWGIGGRLGLLRESFTVPGLSVSAMVHGMSELTLGDPRLVETDGFFQSDVRVWSVRAAATKRVFLLGVTAGVGLDRYVSDTRFGLDTGTGLRTFSVSGLDIDRASAFINAQWTMLILHLVAEVGWQDGPGAYPAPLPTGGGVESGALFGGLTLRLSI